MSEISSVDEDLVRRLPLPLAKLLRRAHNVVTPLEQYLASYYLWEATLKLLGVSAVASYVNRRGSDPAAGERLTCLARPSMGHWLGLVETLVPALASEGDAGFSAVNELIFGKRRDDFPRAAGLDAALRQEAGEKGGPRSRTRLSELFDRLINHRNREIGHGSVGQKSAEFYGRMGRSILAASSEVLRRLDVLAGRRLVYIANVQRQPSGTWAVEWYELIGEAPRRLAPLAWPDRLLGQLPCPDRSFLEAPSERPGLACGSLTTLHPLLWYQPDAAEVFFLNGRKGRRRLDYHNYTSSRVESFEVTDTNLSPHLVIALGFDHNSAESGQPPAPDVVSNESGEGSQLPARPEAKTIGEFELISELGRGAMGVVYRAWQPSIGREVALKCLLGSGIARHEARFAREIRALGRVEHPNLIKIFTSGSDGDHWYYAMELIQGATLATVLEALQQASPASVPTVTAWLESVSSACERARRAEPSLSSDIPAHPQSRFASEYPKAPAPSSGRRYHAQIAELIRQVAGAAHALHEAGAVHRDIKPGNIMIRADGSQAILMDLGLAQLADAVDDKLTRTREFVGTPRYASPEQVLALGRVDRRSDVYSLGATLWELLTLRPISEAADLRSWTQVTRSTVERVRKHQKGVPADLERIVMKCVEREPRRRYATARELADDLARFLAGERVHARPALILNWSALRAALTQPRAAWLVAPLIGAALACTAIVLPRPWPRGPAAGHETGGSAPGSVAAPVPAAPDPLESLADTIMARFNDPIPSKVLERNNPQIPERRLCQAVFLALPLSRGDDRLVEAALGQLEDRGTFPDPNKVNLEGLIPRLVELRQARYKWLKDVVLPALREGRPREVALPAEAWIDFDPKTAEGSRIQVGDLVDYKREIEDLERSFRPSPPDL